MAKGEDCKVMVMVDGAEVDSFRALLDVKVTWGFSTDAVEYVGADAVEIDENNDPATLSLRFNPQGPDYARFVDYRRRRALPADHPDRVDATFDATLRINHADKGTERWAFPDLKVGEAGVGVAGRKPRVDGDVTCVCVNPKLTI